MNTALLVDSHCHLDRLDLSPYQDNLEGALKAALENGVGKFLCVCIDIENYPNITSIAEKHDNIYLSVGVHPNSRDVTDPTTEQLIELAQQPKVIAIGETGLDYFRTKKSDSEWQRERFRRHIAAAKQTGKPLIIHMRDATEDTLRIMKEEGADEIGGVMHCFAENWEVAQQALALNFYISFSGIVTFNSAKDLKEVAKIMPMDKMLVETDSPYLAPVPFRGKPNEPAYVRYVAEQIAELRGMPYEEVATITTQNFNTLFKLT
jgi:TatD DNase family protein